MTDATTYLAPKLKDEGYTGSTANTPYKPANPDQLARLQDVQANAPVVSRVISPNAIVLNINFDGTQNNGAFPAPGESSTNVYKLSQLQAKANGDANTIYLPGVGAQTAPSGTLLPSGNLDPASMPSKWDSIPSNAGKIANNILEDAYFQLTTRVQAIRSADPNAEISINLSGFSRGAAETFAFANLLGERGIPGYCKPGDCVVDTLSAFDPVSQTNGQLNVKQPTNVKNT